MTTLIERSLTATELLVPPAVTGTIRAGRTKVKHHRVAKRQWAAYIGVALATTLLAKALNELVDRRLGDD